MMFCFKCGANLPDGSAFCPKCGTKLTAGNPAQPAVAAAAPEKKKYNVFIIVGIVLVLLIIIIIACSGDSGDSGKKSDNNLSTSADTEPYSDNGLKLFSGDIGKRRTYDNEFGNMAVTLDNIEFVEYYETVQFGYSNTMYPDEDCLYLCAFITIENIGTENSSLLAAWNTVVYDNKYEFSQTYIDGETIDIKPLSKPLPAVLIFEVPAEAAASDKPLVLNINDGAGKAVISYVIRDDNNSAYSMDTGSAETEKVTETEPAPEQETEKWRTDYAEKVRELSADSSDYRFDLVDIDGDDVPELAAGQNGYYVNLYTWNDGKVITVEENMPYGTALLCYTYLPGKNVIIGQCRESGPTGVSWYYDYMKIDDNFKFAEITEEEFFSYDYDTEEEQVLEGTKTASEMLS